jgi:hypothetical protein
LYSDSLSFNDWLSLQNSARAYENICEHHTLFYPLFFASFITFPNAAITFAALFVFVTQLYQSAYDSVRGHNKARPYEEMMNIIVLMLLFSSILSALNILSQGRVRGKFQFITNYWKSMLQTKKSKKIAQKQIKKNKKLPINN